MNNTPFISATGHEVKGSKLIDWEPLLEQWVTAVGRFCQLAPGKPPYWYNERANVSLLAGAAWLSGWISVAEMNTMKQASGVRSENPEVAADKLQADLGWRGQLDLWLKSNSGIYVVEAKQGWPYLDGGTEPSTISVALDTACADVQAVDLTEPQTRVGVAFCAPYINRKLAGRIQPSVQTLMLQMADLRWDAMAWCFPQGIELTHTSNVYPGIVLLARVVEDIHNG